MLVKRVVHVAGRMIGKMCAVPYKSIQDILHLTCYISVSFDCKTGKAGVLVSSD